MKFISFFSIILIILTQTSCGSKNMEQTQEYSGTIQAAGITTYQYGTHRLDTDTNFYALKSDQIDLQEYEGENVTITATKIQGYPVENGPIYLNVKKIDRQQ